MQASTNDQGYKYKARLDHSGGHRVKRLDEAADDPANLDGLLVGVTSRLEAAETNVVSERLQEVSRHEDEVADDYEKELMLQFTALYRQLRVSYAPNQ